MNSFHPACVSEVENVTVKSPNKSCELDPFHTDLIIKKRLFVTAPAMTSIINASFETGDVPIELKTAISRPTLKKPNLDNESLQNYRPISNLPFASKVMERISFSRQLHYLKDQSAYRPDYSVETLLTDLTDQSLRQMDVGNITAVVLLDMSFAFDTVDHPILIERLRSSLSLDSHYNGLNHISQVAHSL